MAQYTLHTSLCDLLDIRYPIMLAGMAPGIADPVLVAAVSNAGGLGVLGCGDKSPEEMAQWIRETRRLTSQPFGVDTVLPTLAPLPQVNTPSGLPREHLALVDRFKKEHGIPQPSAGALKGATSEGVPVGIASLRPEMAQKQIEVVLEERVPVFVSGLGNPASMVGEAHARGIKVMAVVGNTKNARRVAQGGVDVVIASGAEGGGHTSRVGTMALIPQVVDAVHPVLVAAGGGIMDGRGLVAALALGACGVWCGTAFLASQEARIGQWYRQYLLEADEEATLASKWLTGKNNRHLRTPWDEVGEYSGLKPLPAPLQGLLVQDMLLGAWEAGKYSYCGALAGQGVGMLQEIKPARQIVEEMVATAQRVLEEVLPRGSGLSSLHPAL